MVTPKQVTLYVYDPTVGKDVPIDDASEEAKKAFSDHVTKVLKKVGMDYLWKTMGYKFRFVHTNEEVDECFGCNKAFGVFPISLVSVKATSKRQSGLIQMDYDDDGQWYYMVTPYRKMPYDDHEIKMELEKIKHEAYKRRKGTVSAR
ncbi:hypothetical protein [Alicyclobacillus dauci]|uniref:Uncharacterized protein n=1 Tax=Alicyclobacillus dauci TaxID=1475485 RepID=A0ABY6Z9E5_9BACL|nr:hypothetical protein [Alicyclobacillus dauci]WAH39518.1 hypothetical protein NZD86_24435 [Alicyclobacillus dauci]WAH39578.1 hypothetical protein NZD86_24135 [Alicyclobacillus dauci]